MSNQKSQSPLTYASIMRAVDTHIANHLIKYPLTYEYLLKSYRLLRSFIRKLSAVGEKDESSRKYISKELGLVQLAGKKSEGMIHPLRSFVAYYEEDEDFSDHKTDIKAIAYYLPQFHAIPENDEWWGAGFTEWTNTRKSEPLFPGHYQPREPHDDIGYYDLSDIKVLKKQVSLAKRHGIFGFCFYHYWFHGKRLLGKPVDLLLNHPEIDMPFCLCWANETWSKKWDGKDHLILIKQTFSPEDDLHFIRFLAPYFRDPRYLRIGGKPLLMVYRVSKIPNPVETVQRWRNWANENGIGELHLVAVTHGEVFPHTSLGDIGFDAYAAFPPHNFPCKEIDGHGKLFVGGHRFDYESGVDAYLPATTNSPMYEGCTIGWDNTPRFGQNATIYLNFSLYHYYIWLQKIIGNTRARHSNPDDRLIFINAWNEWAEGAYLEPDKKYGYAYLNTTSKALFDIPIGYMSPQKELHISSLRYAKEYNQLNNTIEEQKEDVLTIITRFIKPSADVLEFGPSSGYFTRYLKEKYHAVVDIVEIDKSCAERAAEYARSCHVGDIERFAWKDDFAGRRYDLILFADVLEHLRDPWKVLSGVVPFLKQDGRIIISVPNIAHAQILACLYNNDFSYSSTGILDKTHLRFFTDLTIRQMVEEAGLQVCELVPVQRLILPEGCSTSSNQSSIPFKLKQILSRKRHAYAIQFVVCCKRK